MKVAFVYINSESNVGRGAGCVAAAIMKAGHELKFFDSLYVPIEAVAKEIIKCDFDVFMVSTMTIHFNEALRLIRLVKRRKNIPVLLGGVHATIKGREILEQYPEIDYLCVGEGESMVVDFLRAFGTDEMLRVPNLGFRSNGQVRVNPLAPAENLAAQAPFPWDFFPRNSVVQKTGFLYVSASRGCPYNCTYCSNGIYLRHYGRSYLRFKPVDQIVDELKLLKKKYAPRLFYFGDEMIFSCKDNAVKLFKAIKQEVGLPYGLMVRVEYVDEEVAALLAETGCRYVAMGIECGNEEFRAKYLNRRMSNQQIEKAFALLKQAGVFTTSFNMIGYPFENDAFLTEETIKLNQKIAPDYVQVSAFYPFPGTKLYDRCIELDLIDQQKIKGAKKYFSDSVLKGVSLSGKLAEINALFNPRGFQFDRQVPPRKKVLIISESVASGFTFMVGPAVLGQLSALKQRHDLTIVAPLVLPWPRAKANWQELKQALCIPKKGEINGVPYFRPRFFGLPLFLQPLNDFLRVLMILITIKLNRIEFDLIQAHYLHPPGFVAALLSRVTGRPLVASCEGSDVHQYTEPDYPDKLRRRRVLYALKKAGQLVTVSEFLKQKVTSLGIPGNKVRVAHNGFDSDVFYPRHQAAARHELGLPLDKKILLNVGVLKPVKGTVYLIEAFAKVLRQRDDLFLFIVGSGPLQGQLANRAKALGLADRVVFLGFIAQRELALWFNAADLFVLPSLNEGFGMVVVEALACGLPVVASRTGGIPEIINSSDLGVLVAPGHIKKLADGIELALRRQWGKLRLIQRAEYFNWEKSAKTKSAIYEQLVGAA